MEKNKLATRILKLKPSQAIALFIKVNKKPIVALNQDTFGEVIEDVCYGCSATNALLALSKLKKENIYRAIFLREECKYYVKQRYLGFMGYCEDLEDISIVDSFESAIEALRSADLMEFLRTLPYTRRHEVQDFKFTLKDCYFNIFRNEKEWKLSGVIMPYVSNQSQLDAIGIQQLNEVIQILKEAGF